MESTFFPFVLVIFASLFQGSFGVGMKYMSPLKWEAWWLVHVTISMVLFPLSWALISVPGLGDIIASAPTNAILLAMTFGFLWGIGSLVHWFIGSLVHWFIGSLVHCFIGSLVHWFIGSLVHSFIGSLVHWFIGSLVHWFIGSLVHWIIGSLVHWFTGS